jgi:hypothetical protein
VGGRDEPGHGGWGGFPEGLRITDNAGSDNTFGAQRLDFGGADPEPLAEDLGNVLAQ